MDRNCLVKNTFIALVRVNIEIFPQKKKNKMASTERNYNAD